jgi:hypothetical protein
VCSGLNGWQEGLGVVSFHMSKTVVVSF